jgi:hypothetical protein
MDSLLIEKILKKDQYTSKIFLGVFARDELPAHPPAPSCFVFNTEVRGKPGAHWLGLYINKHAYAELFDSFGHSASYFGLDDYLLRTCSGWNWNRKQIQASSDLCGLYCCLFLVACSRNRLPSFYKEFSKNQIKNDDMLFNFLNLDFIE